MAVRRRRSPGWIRSMDRPQLHSMAVKLGRLRNTTGISARQEWLWDALISELEYRHLHEPDVGARCCCELCWVPYDDGGGFEPLEALEDYDSPFWTLP